MLRRKKPVGYTTRNGVQLLHGGAEFFSVLEELIAEAQHSIHLQTYIYNDDQTGIAVSEALKEAARRGVKVYVLVDGYASRDLPDAFIESMEEAGVNFRYFQPLFKSDRFYFGRRLHHKVMVFDHRTALVSGTNIADRYNDLPGQPAWLDMALRVEGEAVLELYNICCKLWNKDVSRSNRLPLKKDVVEGELPDCQCSVRVLQNDWVRRKQEVWRAYSREFRTASRSITIMCSYFLPGEMLRKRLAQASRRGVKVRVVLAGTSDVAISKHAERYLYRWMLRHHIEIYEYQPTVLHAKVSVVDGDWLTLGSYNINDISTFASVELNLEVRDGNLAVKAQNEIERVIKEQCVHINTTTFPIRLFSFRQLKQWLAYYSIRVVLTLSTFYFRQED
ncbi:MAG TPA: phospholipase D-like domain-containing protein [Chitinophagaceae bacterium]